MAARRFGVEPGEVRGPARGMQAASDARQVVMNAQLQRLTERLEYWQGMPIAPADQEIRQIAGILDDIMQQLQAIDARLVAAEGDAHHANNIASCLANGMKPD